MINANRESIRNMIAQCEEQITPKNLVHLKEIP